MWESKVPSYTVMFVFIYRELNSHLVVTIFKLAYISLYESIFLRITSTL